MAPLSLNTITDAASPVAVRMWSRSKDSTFSVAVPGMDSTSFMPSRNRWAFSKQMFSGSLFGADVVVQAEALRLTASARSRIEVAE